MSVLIYLENETDRVFDFDCEDIANKVIATVLKVEECPYEVEVNVLITDDAGIQNYNLLMRQIDAPTDVLSFPNLDYEEPSMFYMDPGSEADYTNPETGRVILGDIILNWNRIFSQSQEYGHSVKREFAFLLAHSMYHLCGYDHMTQEDAEIMENKQEHILQILEITREMDGKV